MKWPNDLVVGTADGVRKVSGILAESILLRWSGRGPGPSGSGSTSTGRPYLPPDLADIAIVLQPRGRSRDRSPRAARPRAAQRARSLLRLTGDGRGPGLAPRRVPIAVWPRSRQPGCGSSCPGETFEGDAIDITAEGHLLVVDECPDRPA